MSDGADPKLAEGLRHLGLTEYEIRVYLSILRHPGSRIPEIAGRSSVPQPKVYATMKRLIGRGLCESELGPVNTYTALPPEEALFPLLDELRDRASGAEQTVTRLQHEFVAGPADTLGAREGRIKVFQGRQANLRNFRERVTQSGERIDLISRMPMMVRDDDDVLSEAIGRGVSVRILVEAPDDFDFSADDLFRRQLELGTASRSLPRVPMRLGLFDRRVSVLPLDDPAGRERGEFLMLEVRNRSLSEGLAEVFEDLWERGKPL